VCLCEREREREGGRQKGREGGRAELRFWHLHGV
jgi:hypothetical protein